MREISSTYIGKKVSTHHVKSLDITLNCIIYLFIYLSKNV